MSNEDVSANEIGRVRYQHAVDRTSSKGRVSIEIQRSTNPEPP